MSGLVDLSTVALRLGVTRRTIHRYRQHGLPGPVIPHDPRKPGDSNLYSWAEIEEWSADQGLYDSVVGIATPGRKGRYDRKGDAICR